MSAASSKSPKNPRDTDSVPFDPLEITPAELYSSPTHDFTLQAVLSIQKNLGELTASISHMREDAAKAEARAGSALGNLEESIQGVKEKLDSLTSLKNKVLGGVAVISVIFTTFVSLNLWDKYEIAEKTATPAATAPMGK